MLCSQVSHRIAPDRAGEGPSQRRGLLTGRRRSREGTANCSLSAQTLLAASSASKPCDGLVAVRLHIRSSTRPLVCVSCCAVCCAVCCAPAQGVYGCANPGELQGLMGPSGAGKSTLMDLLSKRTDPTGSAAAEAALQHQTFSQRLRTITSHRNSDGTGASTSNDGGVGVTSPSAASAASSSGTGNISLPSRIRAGSPLPHLESELLLNGAQLSRSAFMRLSAYVPQVGGWDGRVGCRQGGVGGCTAACFARLSASTPPHTSAHAHTLPALVLTPTHPSKHTTTWSPP